MLRQCFVAVFDRRMKWRLPGCTRLKQHKAGNIGGRDKRLKFDAGASGSDIDAKFQWRSAAAVENKVIDWIISDVQCTDDRAIVVPTHHVKQRKLSKRPVRPPGKTNVSGKERVNCSSRCFRLRRNLSHRSRSLFASPLLQISELVLSP